MNRPNQGSSLGTGLQPAHGEWFHKAILDALPQHIAVIDLTGIVVSANERWKAFARDQGLVQHGYLGYNYLQVTERAALMGDAYAEEVLQNVRQVISGAKLYYRCEYPCHSPIHQRWFLLEVIPAAAFGGVLMIHTDVSERHRLEEALREGELRFRTMIQVVPSMTFEADSEGNNTFSSDEWCRFTGMSIEETLGSGWRRAVHPQDAEAVTQTWNGAAEAGTLFESRHRMRQADGEYRWVICRALPAKDEKGRVLRWAGAITDIDDLVRTSEALRESEQRFRELANGAPIMIWVIGKDGRTQFINRACADFFGISELGCDIRWKQWIHPEDVQSYLAEFCWCLEQQRPFHARARLMRKDGQWRWFEAFGQPRFTGSGDYLGMGGSSMDITDQKALEEELEHLVQERTRELQQATDELNGLIYSLAHDLRAPLRAQGAYATILLEEFGPALSNQGCEYARRIVESAERQGRLLADLLQHVSLSRSEMPLEPVVLSYAVQQAKLDLQNEITRRSAVIVEEPFTETVLANSASLHLVLTNLISNAIKFVSPDVQPRVAIRSQSPVNLPSGKPGARLWVVDNGLGIHAEFIPKIFRVFYRLHSDAEYSGTGIGLALVKQATERMGGCVGVESEPGKGSKFWIELPLADPPDSPGNGI